MSLLRILHRCRLLPLLALAALLAPASALAQSAKITVTVTRADGTPADFADVTVEGTGGNSNQFADLTDAEGVVTFTGVPPGTYSVTARLEGNGSDSYSIILGPGATQAVKIPLKRLSAEEEVVIVDVRLLNVVDTKDPSTYTELTGDFINKVPLVNRSVQDIVAMMPGVIRVGGADSTEISIGGGTGAQIAYRVDGISANNVIDGGLTMQIASGAIESFKLITSGASAKYGEQSTGVAEIVTKSGGNENDFSYEVQFRDTDYGAQGISGMDQSAKAVDDLLNARGSTLEQEVRAGFRLLGVDPISTTSNDNNPTPRRRIRHTLGAGGPIKKDEAFYHTTLEVLQDDFGSPFVPGFAENDSILWTSKVSWDFWKNPTTQASNRLEFTANLDVRDDDGFVGLRSTRDSNVINTSAAWSLGVTDTHRFANQAVLESKLSFVHQYETTRPENVREGVGTQYEILLPPGGPTSYFVGDAVINTDQTVSTIRGELNYAKAVGSRDQHTIDVGIQADQTFFEAFTEVGDQVSDLRVVDDSRLFGNGNPLIGRAVRSGPPVRTDDNAYFVGLYASDNWEVTDNFTLQLGLRAEYQSFVGKVALGPRIGFALDPIGDGKTRFFGNWGIYYDRLFANFLQFTQRPDREWSRILWAAGRDPQQRAFSDISILDVYKDSQTRSRDSDSRDAIAFERPEVIDRFRGADDVTAPTNKDWTIGISRELPGGKLKSGQATPIRLEVTFRGNSRTHQITNFPVTRRASSEGSAQVRDIVYGTIGEGRFKQWSAEVSRPFSKLWSMNLSYVQSHNVGPVGPPQDPIDPNDVFFVDATLGNDRTHLVKLQGTTKLGKGDAAWDASIDFTWQSGLPVTASLFRDNGIRSEPIGRNSLRLPSSRYLNFGVRKDFQLHTAEAGGFAPTVGVRAQVFNLLNDLNVTESLATFEAPPGISNPQSFPPLRPNLITTGVDLSRSLEVGFTISF
jgi:hypothetical protein